MKFKRKPKELLRPNLIPILDAVFIFIFFLLMTAQFIDIYELASDAPAVTILNKKQEKDKDPLNLVLLIKQNSITLTSGLDMNVIRSMKKEQKKGYNLAKLNAALIDIKRDNIKESSIIFKPDSNVPYSDIIVLMDVVRKVDFGLDTISYINENGENSTTEELFNNIIFETII